MVEQTENEKKYRAALKKLRNERIKLDTKITNLLKKLKKETENKFSYIKNMTVKNADWEEILDLDNPETQVKSKKYNELMFKLGFWPGEYYPETNQRVIKIVLRKPTINRCIKSTIKNLKIIIPHIKPIKSKNGRYYKIVQIFCDHEGGIPELLIKNDGKSCVVCTRYSKFEFLTKWATLKETIFYISSHFPYDDD